MDNMNINNTKTLSIILFLSVITILLIGEMGALTIPGIIAAIIGIGCVFKYQHITALIGITSATCSFIGQYLVAYCPYCTIAAFMFAFAGTLCLINIPQWSLTLIPLMISLIVFSTIFLPEDMRIEYIQPVQASSVTTTGAKLYISLSCPSCKDALLYCISQDKKGETWQPVIVPNSTLQKGEIYLKELGYEGVVMSASASPNRKVPCLVYEDQLYTGTKQIISNFKTSP